MFTHLQTDLIAYLVESDSLAANNTFDEIISGVIKCSKLQITSAYNTTHFKSLHPVQGTSDLIKLSITNNIATIEFYTQCMRKMRNGLNLLFDKLHIGKTVKIDKGHLIILNSDGAYVKGINYELLTSPVVAMLPDRNRFINNTVVQSANCLDCKYYANNKFLYCTISPNGYLQPGCSYERC